MRFSILGLLATMAILCRAQDLVTTNLGWFPIGYYDYETNAPADDGSTVQVQMNFQPQTPPTPPVIAEVITPEIQALADGLQDDPLKIFNYVHDHIRYSLYFGSKKGAELTLLEKSGNDFDQCALLVALLRAAGYSNAGYQFGWMPIPFDNPDGSHRDIHHWFCLNFSNSNWSTTVSQLNDIFTFWRSYPGNMQNYSANFGNNIYAFQRVWVTVTVGGTNYLLDPAFKVSEPIAGISLAAAIGGGASAVSNALMAAASPGIDVGSITTNFYCTNINEAAIRGTLTGFTTNLLNYIQSSYPNASVEQILSGQYIVPSTNTSLSQCFPFQPTTIGAMSVVSWINEPTNMMSTLKINFGGGGQTYQWFMPQLHGDRLAMVYGSSTVQLWEEDSNIASGTFSYYDNATLTINHPRGNWDVTNNVFIQGWYTLSGAETYYPNSTYAISYVFDPDWGWLQARQKKLEGYRAQGLANTNRSVVSETLNVMALTWQLEVGDLSTAIGVQAGVLPMFYQRIGRMAQEAGRGYYVDVAYMTTGSPSSTGNTCNSYNCDPNEGEWFDQFAYFGSAMEHGMIEQLQSSNLVAGSTVKVIEMANTNHQAIYIANSSNWSAVQNQLTNYSISTLAANYINQGYTLLLPQNGQTQMSAGTNGWSGHGFMARLPNNGGTYMLVGPGLDGGYAGNLNATIDPTFINYYGYSQPSFYYSSPPSLPNFTAADPVDMADGTFQVQATDLSLGQTEPRGLSFSRYYNSSRRNSNLAGIAPGWVHNYYINAANISSPEAGLGGTTPAQAAAMLTATASAISFYNQGQLDPKNWTVTALIAKWAIDQLTAKAVSVSLGKDTIQFIQQPDGSYTPPANCTMTLMQSGSTYTLQERHGRTFKFNGSGWCTNIVDPYGQSVTLGYNSSNWVTSATDLKNHSLTFNYSSTSPVRLISVSDSGGRSISLGYSSSNDLACVTDPEGKTNTFLYDTNHQITATFNGLGQLVASNIYNGFGRITTQYTQGNTNRTWRVFWSGWQTVSQDPAGGQQIYFYDDKTRLIGQQDALGNLSQKIYDGQDHIVTTISPLGETNQFVYDVNHNLLETIDPLGFTNQFFYDGQNNLTRALDARNNPSTFGYNGQFSLIGQTNGAGDWVNYTYNSDGTLASRTDSGGAIQYDGYDTYGQLTHITYPTGDHESFGNNPFGDVTSHTDGNGNVATFSYNNRRQLTNSVAPTNILVKLAYDAAGNQLSATDARGNTASNVWSATGKLLAVILPSTPQGTPVTTNSYDNRDWLAQTLNPLQKATQFTDDSVGHLLAMTDPLSRTATLGYDADGRTIAATNAVREVTRQTWDARGKLIKLTDGAQHTSSRGYDGAGNQIILTNRNGQVWQFQFDGANRLTTTTSPGTRQTVLTWNHQGLLNTVKDPLNQTTTLNYDGKRRLTNRVDNVGTTTFGYDANNNQTSVIENGNTNTWTYDAYNHVSSYKDIYGNLIQYRYDANGNLTNLIYPGGRTVAYFYDSLNRLTNVTDWAQRKTTLTYDLANHVTGITRPNGSYRTMSYDAAGQLSNVWEQMANTLPIAWFRFNWNSNATVNWEFLAPPPHSVTVPTRTMTYDSDNRLYQFQGPSMGSLQSVSIDSDGNLTSGPLTNDTFAAYTYDARNRSSNAGGVTNTYDPAGNRIAIAIGTNTTRFVVNPNANLPQVLMRIKNGVTNYYVYGPGLLYQVTETATRTNTLTYHFDYRGSTIALSGDNGVVTDRIEYSLYGLITYRAGTSDTPFLFNGKYGVTTDPNGLFYMQARFYNPYLCRFISADPSGFGGGLNFYAYANANPVSYLDPFGLGAVSDNLLASASWFNAPTPEEQQMQQVLAGFVNLVTLGGANLISSATSGTDLTGNNLNVADAFEQSLETTAFVSSLAFSLPADVPAITLDGAGGDVLLNQTLRLVDTLDWSTAPDAAVVYSGNGQGALATAFAQQNNLTTIAMTQGGQQLEEDLVFQRLFPAQQRQVWEYASTPFAQGASGNVNAFVLNPRPASTFLNVELPILQANPNVNLIHH
jgi:RHS repeat-associated protein